MSTIRKFAAVRPAKELAEKVAALPYDVMNEEEARLMTKDNPHSFLNIDRSEVCLPLGTDPHSKEVYEMASFKLKEMIETNVLIREDKPCLYIYKLTMNGVSQVGLVCSTSVDEYINETIKKHEFTRPDKEEDRINHVDYCNANTGPIFMAYKGTEAINEIINNFIENNAPVYDFVAEDKIGHTVWVIDNDDISNEIIELFVGVENLYIADGHHRNASAVKVALKRREALPSYTGEEEFNFYLSVLFPHSQLRIFDYNRVVADLNGLTKEDFIAKVSNNFIVSEYAEKGCYKPEKIHEFGMYLDGKWYVLTAKDSVIATDAVGALDVAILQNSLLTPVLGIDDPRTDKRIDFVGGIRGLEELEKRVHSGKWQVAFSMFPTSMEELMKVADSNNVMPPKSTWFEPKLRSGLFIHELS